MDVEYEDKRAEHAVNGRIKKAKLPIAVIARLQEKILFIGSAFDERDLINWRSLHFEPLEGDRKGEHSIRLNDQWRLCFRIEYRDERTIIVVTSVEDYHKG